MKYADFSYYILGIRAKGNTRPVMKVHAIYQPVMLMVLLRKGGRAADKYIVKAFAAEPERQDWSEEVLLDVLNRQRERRGETPGQVLADHHVVEQVPGGYALLLDEPLNPDQVSELLQLCANRLAAYRQSVASRVM